MGTDGPQVSPVPGRLPLPLIPLFLHGITPFRTVAHTIPPIVRGEAYHRNIWYTLGLSTRFSTGLHHLSDTRTFVRLPCPARGIPYGAHHLARIMLLEQLYRAFQIQEGTRYHK